MSINSSTSLCFSTNVQAFSQLVVLVQASPLVVGSSKVPSVLLVLWRKVLRKFLLYACCLFHFVVCGLELLGGAGDAVSS